MLYKTKTGVSDCVNSCLVKIPATQAISSDVLIRCLVVGVHAPVNERSYFFLEVAISQIAYIYKHYITALQVHDVPKCFIFNLSRRNEDIW